MDVQTPRKSFARRLFRAVVFLALIVVLMIGALPWVASTPPAKNAIVAAVNRKIAPSKIGMGGISLSWAGAIRLTGLTLVNKEGKTLVSAKKVTLDRGLIALARNHSKLGTLTVDGAMVDVERRADGWIDLLDALMPPSKTPEKPVLEPEPVAKSSGSPTDITIRVTRSTIKLTTPELLKPLHAHQADVEVKMPSAAGEKLSWKIRLAEPEGGTAEQTLGIDGEFDHQAAASPDMAVTVKGENWPLAVRSSGATVHGKLVGLIKAGRSGGLWASSGNAKLVELDASGPALSGDALAFDEVVGDWDLSETGAAWSVRKLGLICPVGSIAASGSLAGAGSAANPDARVEAKIDLAALAKQLPHTLRLREGLTLEKGSARAIIQLKGEGESQHAEIDANISDLTASRAEPAKTFTLRDPGTLVLKAMRGPAGLKVEALALKSGFLKLDGSGDLDKGIRLSGTVDLGKIESEFKELIDFKGLEFVGSGGLVGDYRKTPKGFLGRFAAQFKGLKIAGLTSEPLERDALRLDAAASGPIEANGTPSAFENVRLNVKSSEDTIAIAVTNRDGVASINSTASVPVTISSRDGRFDMKAVGRWKSRKEPETQGLIEFDELRLGLKPTDPKLGNAGHLAFAARGWVDLDSDDLQITPLPAPSPLVLSGEGLKLHGLRKTPLATRAGQAKLIGDVSAIESALFVWMGRQPTGLGGAMSLQLGMGPGSEGKLNLGINLGLPDLTRLAADGKSRTVEGPIMLGLSSAYEPSSDKLFVENFIGLIRYAKIEAKGTLDAPNGQRLADLQGVITPNWDTLTTMAAAMTEPSTKLQGKERSFRLKGPLAGGSLATIIKGLDAEIGIDMTSASVFGLAMGPVPVVVRCANGAVTVDPIKTTLSGGVVDLKPGLSVEDATGIALLFAQGSKLEGVQINDEVSKDLLSYVAPVLDKATNVHGKINLAIDKADIPITGPPTEKLSMTGKLAFQDLTFAPGPFAKQMLGLVGKANDPGLQINQPIELSILNDRVYQNGLTVPITADATIALSGSVGFDETLDMKAEVPVTKSMLGPAAGLDAIVSGNKITVPIGGTVSKPTINRQALQVALRELSRNILKKEISGNPADLLKKFGVSAPAGGSNGGGGGGLEDLGNQLLRQVAPGGDRNP